MSQKLARKIFDLAAFDISEILEWIQEATDSLLDMRESLKLQLALEEAVVNIYSYGFVDRDRKGELSISLELLEGEKIEVELVDNGVSFDPTEHANNTPSAETPLEERKIGGLGIGLIHDLMDLVVYRRVEEKNHLLLVKNLV